MISALRARFVAWQWTPVHRRVASAAAVVAVFTLGGKLASAAKEVFVAQRFGTSDDVDAFLLAFLLPSFAINVIGGSLNSALIPTYVQVRDQKGAAAAQRLLATITFLGVALLATMAVLLSVLTPVLLPLVSRDFTPAKLALTSRLSYLLLPSLLLAGTSMTWSAVLNAHQRFAMPAGTFLVIPVATIAAIVLGRDWGIYALALGTVVGYGLQAVLVGVALRRIGVGILPRWGGITAEVRQVLGQFIPVASGMLVMGTNPVIDSAMAARLGPGSVAALGYGGKIEAFAMGVGAMSVGAAVLPHFSELAAAEDWRGLRSSIRSIGVVLLALSVPIAVALIAFSEPIVSTLFERGAFTHTDTILVARIQAFYLAAIPFRFVGLLFLKCIQAVKSNRVLMWISILNAITNVALNYVLSLYLGVAGIALSTSLVYIVAVGVMFAFTRSRLRALSVAAVVEPIGVSR